MTDQQHLFVILVLTGLLIVVSRRRRQSSGAYGTAAWMSESFMRKAGMLAGRGLLLGRTLSGAPLWIRRYCHVLCIGSPGSSKTVSIVFPNLLTQARVVAFDCKNELHEGSKHRRGGRIIRLAPFAAGKEKFNPLDTVPVNDPLLIDHARAMANAMVIRTGAEPESHWNDRAEGLISAILTFVLMRFRGSERTLNSVLEIASSTELLLKTANCLRGIAGIPARMGDQILSLFETISAKDGQTIKVLTKEGASVISTVLRHLSFLCSNAVAESVSESTFRIEELHGARVALFLQIPPEMLESAKGLLRVWVATLIRVLGRIGSERKEILFVLDEASALGGLSALEEAMVRGRSAGLRLCLVYQSHGQVTTAFPKGKESLLYDNCSTQIYLGAASIETGERISKSLGDYTQTIRSYDRNSNRSSQYAQQGSNNSWSYSSGESESFREDKRALLDSSEVLRLDNSLLICLTQGQRPILARKLRWYSDPLFARKKMGDSPFLLLLMACAICIILWGLKGR